MPYGTDTLITVGVWYPTDAPAKHEALGGWTQLVATDAPATAGPHPLIVISHGNGGWFAGHYDFLAPCDSAMAKELPGICTSAPGFDRTRFHEELDSAVVAFFRKALT
jgi:predicted dienelactone hydrolase